jgi:hypothetical protein
VILYKEIPKGASLHEEGNWVFSRDSVNEEVEKKRMIPDCAFLQEEKEKLSPYSASLQEEEDKLTPYSASLQELEEEDVLTRRRRKRGRQTKS